MTPDAPLVPRPDRLDPRRPDYDAILEAHRIAIERGASTYTDPTTGLSVFTSAALLAKGSCCERGCRHCPYPVRTPASD